MAAWGGERARVGLVGWAGSRGIGREGGAEWVRMRTGDLLLEDDGG